MIRTPQTDRKWSPLQPQRASVATLTGSLLHSWVAVTRGAIIRGLEKDRNNSIKIHRCRRSYGISVSQPWSSFKHSLEDEYDDPFDGEKKAKNQMVWLIKKGDAILSSQPKHASIRLCRRFGVKDPRVFRTSLVVSDEDEAPQRYAKIDPAIHYDFTDIPEASFKSIRAGTRGTPYFCAFFRIEITLEAKVKCRVMFDDQERGFEEINYV
ncbi:hypothetical protein GP486_006967 [Trichoglossum hirsutum]|uniref:Uncharacterized protein n=1 Tax=Trichoglossum hirsutum TaxID=265104 RepID=A0A9P8ICS0_9PEZI|nr:hypothetical protein GP486_006967 [Trichoglossum hirsutum]